MVVAPSADETAHTALLHKRDKLLQVPLPRKSPSPALHVRAVYARDCDRKGGAGSTAATLTLTDMRTRGVERIPLLSCIVAGSCEVSTAMNLTEGPKNFGRHSSTGLSAAEYGHQGK